MRTRGGLLSVNGSVEYTPESQTAHLTDVLFEDLRVDYVTSKATRAVEEAHARRALEAGRRVRDAPKLFLRVDTFRMTNAQLGLENDTSKPPYRLFIRGVDLRLENLDNHVDHGRSRFNARGVFMGSGATALSGGFMAAAKQADFEVRLEVNDAKLSDLNPLLMSYAGVDVARGQFSVYTELDVKKGKVEGYIKPLLRNLGIPDRRKDEGKPLVKRAEMELLQFLAYVLENHTTQEVATVVHISGSTRAPETSEWEVIRRLIANGFASAVLPGFRDGSTPADARSPVTPPK